MVTIGFWNVDSLRKVEGDERQIAKLVAGLAEQRSLDLVFLIECAIPSENFLRQLERPETYYPVSCGNRFKVLARFDPQLIPRLDPPVPSDRFDLWHLQLPLQDDVIIAVVHGLDQRNNSVSKQELFLQQVVSAVGYFEKRIGHERSVVIGDFNANPFEPPVASALGMNAVISRVIAAAGPREMLGTSYGYFYNPMWNIYGDQNRMSAPASYYYRGSDPHELYWHMLDQVVLRPSLAKAFQMAALDIVTRLKDQDLLTRSGIPNRAHASDHLPIVFGLDLASVS